MKNALTLALWASLGVPVDPHALQAKTDKAAIHDTIKRNAKYRKLQDALTEFVNVWQAECKQQGKVLQRGLDQNLGCSDPPTPPQPAPKPEEKK